MTSKDYVALAKVIKAATSVREVAQDLIPVLIKDNAAFNADKWLRACGVEPGTAPSGALWRARVKEENGK